MLSSHICRLLKMLMILKYHNIIHLPAHNPPMPHPGMSFAYLFEPFSFTINANNIFLIIMIKNYQSLVPSTLARLLVCVSCRHPFIEWYRYPPCFYPCPNRTNHPACVRLSVLAPCASTMSYTISYCDKYYRDTYIIRKWSFYNSTEMFRLEQEV